MPDIEFTYLRQSPTKWTFEMPLLRKWVEEHSHGKVLNLFAGRVRLNVDEYRVDMSPEYKPDLNMEAEMALRKFIKEGRFFDTVILDPPYSMRMAREKYQGRYYIGKFAKILNLVPRVLNKNGIVITLGYKTGEMSASRDIVFDPFCGSGTTCKMAKRYGRNYIGCDISERYIEIARNRIDNTFALDVVGDKAGIDIYEEDE